ncbi:MAG: HlyD family type I secretion periplasmic adaptor subunit [Verrucomicrobiota bacterium]
MWLFKEQKAILEEALPFQGDLVHLLEEPLPKRLRGTIHACMALLLSALFISIVFHVDIVVNGRGKLTYDAPPIVLQAYERAALRSLLVKPGDTVTKGQVVATLDPTFSAADLGALESRKRLTHARVSRLMAEAVAAPYSPDPADSDAGVLEYQIYQQRTTEYASRIKGFDASIAEAEASKLRTEKETVLLKEQLGISSSIEEMQENLFNYKTNSKLEYLSAKNNRLSAERSFRDATERLVEISHHIQTVNSQKESFIQEWRRTLSEELARQRAEESQIDASLTKSSKINSLVVITAPEDGTVLDVVNRSVGSIIRDTEAVVVLIPSAAPLLCEIELGSGDIGDVAVGDPVIVKVDAYPFQRYGGLEGYIRSIAYESHSIGGGGGDLESLAKKGNVAAGGVHRVVIELKTTRMEYLPKGKILFPGMTVSGEAHVGNRRLISYLLYPILRGLQESFREA